MSKPEDSMNSQRLELFVQVHRTTVSAFTDAIYALHTVRYGISRWMMKHSLRSIQALTLPACLRVNKPLPFRSVEQTQNQDGTETGDLGMLHSLVRYTSTTSSYALLKHFIICTSRLQGLAVGADVTSGI